MTDTHEQLVGQTIASQFLVLKKLGSGGMGAVFLAEQIEMDRKVVVKVLHPEMTAANPAAIERFRREAKAVAQLNHPNIVQVFVFGQAENGQLYLAMEYIPGRDLSHELTAGPMPQPRALRILDQCCSALIEAHGAGIVHRDLKPENIMLSDRHGNPDYVKVLDFGIAKLHDAGGGNNPTLTQAGSVFGTPRYMSPEQVKGEPVDARSDLYALGIILYEMLVGRHPFAATTTIDYLMKHVNEPVAAPSAEGLDIQPRIESLLLKVLEKDPAARYQSAAELQRDVRAALRDFSEAVRGFPSGSTPLAPAVPRATTGTQPPGRSTYAPPGSRPRTQKKGIPAFVWALVGVLILAGVIAIVVAVAPSRKGKEGPPETIASKEPEKDASGPPPDKVADAGTTSAQEKDTALAHAPDTAKPPPDEPVTPTTTLEVGQPFEGFPTPKDAKHTSSTPQVEMFETAASARDLVNFYKAKLAGKYKLKDVPNGLMIEDQDSPFSYITLSPNGDRFWLLFQRNALAPKVDKPAEKLAPAFGIEFPDDASMYMRSAQAFVARSRLGFKQVCDFYEKKYGDINGVMVMRDEQSSTPTCTLAAATAQGVQWMAVAIVNDPTSTGAVMISVVPKQ